MGKTPKKPAPGGDESNLYVRRLKATTTASFNACDSNLPARQRESENPNRGKTPGAQKRLPVPPGKVFKSKLRIPATTKSHRAMKDPPRFQPSTSKEEKKVSGPSTTSKERGQTTEVATMQPESEEAAVQLRVSITKKDVKEGGVRIASSGESSVKVEKEASQQDHGNSNGKDAIELTETENTTPRADSVGEGNDAADKNATAEKLKTGEETAAENGNESTTDTIKNNSKHEESESDNRSSEFGDNALKLEDEGKVAKPSEGHADTQELTKNGEQEKDAAIQETESNISAENCSVDVVESTTSEISDSGNATQSDGTQESTDHPTKDNPENDASFISYDSSIMLKDVQIKLNDCLKENSKLFDVSNVNDESSGAGNATDQEKRLDMSFGKTLRNISGRSTINRLRYVTVREHRFSPNDSLFVNTSSASLDPEDSSSCKMSRHPSEFSDTFLTNCSPAADRKRKIVTESVAASSVKKLKTAETPEQRTSIFNTSLELFKSIRRPVQVSTPNTKGYTFSTDKYSDKGFGDDKLTVEAEAEPKKWCVVM